MAMLTVHLLLLLLGLGVSVNSVVSLQKRIIGGYDCDDKERLYHVRLENSDGKKKLYCGASLIHPEWILTAAHCWKSKRGWYNVAMFKVHPRTAEQQNQVIRHPPVIYPSGQSHDIILLRLQRPVTDVTPVQLPDCNNRLKVGDKVQLAGEGGMTTGPNNQRLTLPPVSSRLQCIDMKVVSVSRFDLTCGHVFDTEEPNKDVCFGDSGSGVIFNGMIYGVIDDCGEKPCQSPAGIMDVCEYMDWIKQTIGLT